MLISHEGNNPNAVDPSLQRQAAGTIGDSHMMPSGVSGTAIGNVISPFDSRVTLGGTWTVQAGASITSFLSYDAFSSSAGSNVNVNFVGPSIAIIGSNLQGGGRFDVYVDGVLTPGIVNTSTYLGANYYASTGRSLNDTDTSITVGDTTNFAASNGLIQIDKEQISYATASGGVFSGCIRGVNGTMATTHTGGITVAQCTSSVDTYAAYDQSRIVLWRSNNLGNGPHSLRIVLRSDANGSSSGTQVTIDGFVLGGLIGAANLHTEIQYVPLTNFVTNGSGIVNSIQISPNNTGQQLIGILGAYPVAGCTWCYPMWNPNSQTISLVTSAVSSTISAVLTVVYAGQTF